MPDLIDLVGSVRIGHGYGEFYTARVALKRLVWRKYKIVATLDGAPFWTVNEGIYNGHGGGGLLIQDSYGVGVMRNGAYNNRIFSISVELFGELHVLFSKNTSDLLVASADAQT
jgi:hypothetical protein